MEKFLADCPGMDRSTLIRVAVERYVQQQSRAKILMGLQKEIEMSTREQTRLFGPFLDFIFAWFSRELRSAAANPDVHHVSLWKTESLEHNIVYGDFLKTLKGNLSRGGIHYKKRYQIEDLFAGTYVSAVVNARNRRNRVINYLSARLAKVPRNPIARIPFIVKDRYSGKGAGGSPSQNPNHKKLERIDNGRLRFVPFRFDTSATEDTLEAWLEYSESRECGRQYSATQ